MPNIKKLHIGSPRGDIIGVSITPVFASTLTHLSLKTFFVDSKSPYEIVLRYGTNLRSLPVDGPLEQPSSQHFRRYSHALPYLTEFGVTHYSLQQDADFFPAVCDFLRPKAEQLVHLELKSATNKYLPDRLGFKECWDMFPSTTDPITVTVVSFPQLESLSITLLAGRKNLTLHYSNRIPPSVTSLSLSGSQLGEKSIRQLFKVVSFYSFHCHIGILMQADKPQSKKRIHRWPPNLRIISLDFGIARCQTVDLNQAQMVAKCIPTLRVLKFVPRSYQAPAYWSVCWDEASNIVRCEAWNERETSVLVEEMLDRFECQDTSFG